ncbi:MAG TPA: hypothetical protein VFU10_04210 [Gaiellaceae bacterium]|nr:hypothetical protein [Gaiellaceae bacterium]
MRRLVLLTLLALAAFVVIRRRREGPDGADVWFDDGSVVSLPRSSPAGSRLAELADDVLSAAG